MTDTSPSQTSLLSHCISCKSSCCKNDRVIVTEIGYTQIMDAGHPDYFHHIMLDDQNYYILDHTYNQDGSTRQNATCPYLQHDYRCSIEDVKPAACKAYPLVRHASPFQQGFFISPDCPANDADTAMQDFVDHATSIAQDRAQMLPMSTCFDIIKHHNAALQNL